MRAFIAIELEEHLRQELVDEIGYLRSHFPEIRWVKPENLHVTLKFLGDIDENDITEICDIMEEVAERHVGFTLSVENLGCFPDLRYPRTVWAGCALGGDSVERIGRDLGGELQVLGCEPDRKKFSPHITLGRVKKPSDARGIEDIIADAPTIQFGVFDVEKITLYMSELKREGARYSEMFSAELSV